MADSDDEGPSHRVERSEESISIFLRVKPVANPSKSVAFDTAEGTVQFHAAAAAEDSGQAPAEGGSGGG